MNAEDLFTAMVMLAVGSFVLLKADWLVRNAINSEDAFCRRLGISQASEKTRRFVGKTIANLLGWAFIFGGLLQLYGFLVGQKFFK